MVRASKYKKLLMEGRLLGSDNCPTQLGRLRNNNSLKTKTRISSRSSMANKGKTPRMKPRELLARQPFINQPQPFTDDFATNVKLYEQRGRGLAQNMFEGVKKGAIKQVKSYFTREGISRMAKKAILKQALGIKPLPQTNKKMVKKVLVTKPLKKAAWKGFTGGVGAAFTTLRP